jgi:hypothetical protein
LRVADATFSELPDGNRRKSFCSVSTALAESPVLKYALARESR